MIDLNEHEGPEDLTLPVEVRVKQGMALLDDKYGPEWVAKIDVRHLFLDSTCNCVLGQVYGDYADGLGALELWDSDNDADAAIITRRADHDGARYGFTLMCEGFNGYDNGDDSWGKLTSAWRLAILARRAEEQRP